MRRINSPTMIVILAMGIGSLATLFAINLWPKSSFEISAPLGVHAATSAGNKAFSVATGQIDENIEGLFILDGLTGDLTGHIVSTFNGKFFARMQHNVLGDLGIEDDKNTQLLMVTGLWNFRGQTGQIRPSNSIIYIVDASTGNFAAYAVPWNKTMLNKGRSGNHLGSFQLLGVGKSRTMQLQP